ncbi:MAG: hypothetical protein JO305_09320 [Alphaproteobacteria bacterium]|nr:hypothetical protein [Alphaproteobacteria bacterium]
MRNRRMTIAAVFAAGLAALPLSTAAAQYYRPCPPSPLFWPFCAVAVVVGTAATIVTAPVRALTGVPPYPYGYYPPPYYPPGYYAPPYYPFGYYAPAYYYGPR